LKSWIDCLTTLPNPSTTHATSNNNTHSAHLVVRDGGDGELLPGILHRPGPRGAFCFACLRLCVLACWSECLHAFSNTSASTSLPPPPTLHLAPAFPSHLTNVTNTHTHTHIIHTIITTPPINQMYDPPTETPAMARTSNMNGDLGSVRYVFSDKTGTLTQNVMRFRRCSVAGQVFGNLGEGEEEKDEANGGDGGDDHDEQIRLEEGSSVRTSNVSGGGSSSSSSSSSNRPSHASSAASHPYAVQGLPLRCVHWRALLLVGSVFLLDWGRGKCQSHQSTNQPPNKHTQRALPPLLLVVFHLLLFFRAGLPPLR
jgi:hypothetical protein